MATSDRPVTTLRLWLLLTVAFVLTSAAGAVFSSRFLADQFMSDARRDALGLTEVLALSVAGQPDRMDQVAELAARHPDIDFARVLHTTPSGLQPSPLPFKWMAGEAAIQKTSLVSPKAVPQDGTHKFIGYSPLYDRSSRLVGVLAVEVRSDRLTASLNQLGTGAFIGVVVVVLVSALFAAGIARMLVWGPNGKRFARALSIHRYTQTAVLEMLLATLAISTLAIGIFGVNAVRNGNDKMRQIELRLATVPKGMQVEGTQRYELQTLRAESDNHLRSIAAAFVISTILTIGAVVLLRASVSREHDLEVARHEAARNEAAHQQVAEHLPIGFYTFGEEGISFCNAAWQRLVEMKEGEDPRIAFERALHPDDREDVVAALHDAVVQRSGFGFNHRLITSRGDVRYLETRGVPIVDHSGNLEHVVGFSIDVSARVRARQLLEAKTSELETTNDRLRQALSDQEDNFEAMVHSLVKAVEAKDPYTAGHSARVMRYSVRVGAVLGMSPHELRVLRMGALIHDIGKIGVPDAILTKPSALDDAEMEVVRRHPVIGAKMVEGIPTFRECIPIIRQHHERLNGSGYPDNLRAELISLPVRIVAVADSFDAMTSGRAYRQGFTVPVALAELRKSAHAGALDPKIVECLADIVTKDGLLDHYDELTAA